MTEIDKQLEQLRKELGIIDEGNIVDNDDFETSLTVSTDELLKGVN